MRWQKLTSDIKAEILSRLPAKSLVRSRCVCKPWLSLLSSPSFIRRHLNRTTLNPSFDDDDESFIVLTRPGEGLNEYLSLLQMKNPNVTLNLDHPYPLVWSVDVVGSINGLVCVGCRQARFFALWNPVTKQCKKLPHPDLNAHVDDLPVWTVSVGFCYDAVKNDYKIVRIVSSEQLNPQTRVELYATSSNSWREIVVEDLPFRLTGIKCETIVKGEPYWRADLGGVDLTVVWFDAGNEVFRHVPIVGLPLPDSVVYLVSFKDSLALAVSRPSISPGGAVIIDVWVVEEDGFAWSKKYTAGPLEDVWRVEECSRNGLFLEMGGNMNFYCSQTKETKNVLSDGGMELRYVQVCNYTASLVSIRGSKKVIREDFGWGKKS